MEPYPLESLLTVRHYREEGAKRRVRTAENALRESEQAVDKAQEDLELEEFRPISRKGAEAEGEDA